MGVHSIQRSVATALLEHDDLKQLWVYRFLRWAEGSLGLGVMPRYVRTPVSETDAKVINRHPYVAMWKDMIQFLPYLPQYESVCNMFKLIGITLFLWSNHLYFSINSAISVLTLSSCLRRR